MHILAKRPKVPFLGAQFFKVYRVIPLFRVFISWVFRGVQVNTTFHLALQPSSSLFKLGFASYIMLCTSSSYMHWVLQQPSVGLNPHISTEISPTIRCVHSSSYMHWDLNNRAWGFFPQICTEKGPFGLIWVKSQFNYVMKMEVISWGLMMKKGLFFPLKKPHFAIQKGLQRGYP